MPVSDHPDPKSFVGRGTVWLAWDDEKGAYSGYWDVEPDGRPTFIEGMPETTSVEAALAWAQGRASRIMIRPEGDPDAYYWAGVGAIPKDVKAAGMKPLEMPPKGS